MSDLPKQKKTRFKKAPPLPDFDMTLLYSADAKSRRRRLGKKSFEEELHTCGQALTRVRVAMSLLEEENAVLRKRLGQIDAIIHPPPNEPLVDPFAGVPTIAQIFGGM
jgi:hypothetical protein